MIGSNYIGRNGRFANQMFQYAALRGIAAKHNYDICMPSGSTRWFCFVSRQMG